MKKKYNKISFKAVTIILADISMIKESNRETTGSQHKWNNQKIVMLPYA